MTDERFTLNSVLNFDFGICDYGEPLGSLRNICELLNELHEENKKLNQVNEMLQMDFAMTERNLIEENEQLKSEYKVLHTQYQDLEKFVENNFDEYLTQEKLNRQIIKLSDENEELKQEINELNLKMTRDLHDFLRK